MDGCRVTQGTTKHVIPDTLSLCNVDHVDHRADSVCGCGSNGRLLATAIEVGDIQLTVFSLFIYHVHRDHTFNITIDVAAAKHIGMLTTIEIKSDVTAVTNWENRIKIMERICHFADVGRIGNGTA